jgi:lysylphosphatidylglycerol synthetase-like protein (DUF2156 family)
MGNAKVAESSHCASGLNKGDYVETAHFIGTWTILRKSIVQSQMLSVIVLAVALALVATGQFMDATLEVKVFALTVLVTTGALSVINQFAAIREGFAVAKDLSGATSATEMVIASSVKFLRLTQVMLIVFSLTTLVFFVLAIF